MAKIDFFALPGCPYCAKVERKLNELDVTYEKHEVPPDHADRTQVRDLTGRTQVPVIVDRAHGIEGMDESERIVSYLEETYA